MEGKELQLRRSELTISKPTSLTEFDKMLAVEMNLTAQNSKSEPASELVAEFSRELAGVPADGVQWAFRQWRRESPFWPAVSDIRERTLIWYGEQRYQAEQREKARING